LLPLAFGSRRWRVGWLVGRRGGSARVADLERWVAESGGVCFWFCCSLFGWWEGSACGKKKKY
jgi:hypothetical protein